MEWIKRFGVRVQPILLVFALLSALPGCGEEQSDFDKASRGELKTPDQMLKEAKEKEAKYKESLAKSAPAPAAKEEPKSPEPPAKKAP